MYTNGAPFGEDSAREPAVSSVDCRPVGAVQHYACAVASLLATGLILLAGYSALVALTRPLHVLSSTALVFAVVSLWLLMWAALEVTWEWRAGRLSRAP